MPVSLDFALALKEEDQILRRGRYRIVSHPSRLLVITIPYNSTYAYHHRLREALERRIPNDSEIKPESTGYGKSELTVAIPLLPKGEEPEADLPFDFVDPTDDDRKVAGEEGADE